MTFLRSLLYCLACIAMAALAWTLVCVSLLVNSARTQVERVPDVLKQQGELLRQDAVAAVNGAIQSASRDAKEISAQWNTTIDQHADTLTALLDNRVREAVSHADSQLTRLNDSVATAASVAVPARAAAEKIDQALPFYTDCDAGMCLANVIYGMAKNTEQTMRSVDRTMDVIAQSAPPVAASVEKSAAAVEVRSRQSILRNFFFSLKTTKP